MVVCGDLSGIVGCVMVVGVGWVRVCGFALLWVVVVGLVVGPVFVSFGVFWWWCFGVLVVLCSSCGVFGCFFFVLLYRFWSGSFVGLFGWFVVGRLWLWC